jgi:hypothetical protein
MSRRLVGLLSLVLFVGLMGGVGYANIIPLDLAFTNSPSGSVVYTNTGANSATVTFTGVSGTAVLGGTYVGTYSLANATLALTNTGGSTYSIASTPVVLTVVVPGFGTLKGDWAFGYTNDGSNPQGQTLWSSFTATSSTVAFQNAGFPDGVTVDSDFTITSRIITGKKTKPTPTLDGVYAGTLANMSGKVSAGEVVADPSPAPEPGTIALLGSGLIAMAGFLRRRF